MTIESETQRLIRTLGPRVVAETAATPAVVALLDESGGAQTPPDAPGSPVLDDPDEWAITFRGRTWTSSTAQVRHLAVVAELTTDEWSITEPWRSPRLLAAWITAFLTDTTGDIDAALAIVYASPMAELLGACTRSA